MPDVRIASRHHTVDDQVALVCRMLARQIEGYLLELDECESTRRLGLLAEDLWRAGGKIEQSKPPTGRGRLHLVAS